MDGPFVAALDRGRSLLAAGAIVLLSASALVGAPAARELRVRGVLTAAAVDNPGDRWSAGTLTVGAQRIVVPPHLLIELPGVALTLQEIFALAPERCRRDGATGLLATDAAIVLGGAHEAAVVIRGRPDAAHHARAGADRRAASHDRVRDGDRRR